MFKETIISHAKNGVNKMSASGLKAYKMARSAKKSFQPCKIFPFLFKKLYVLNIHKVALNNTKTNNLIS